LGFFLVKNRDFFVTKKKKKVGDGGSFLFNPVSPQLYQKKRNSKTNWGEFVLCSRGSPWSKQANKKKERLGNSLGCWGEPRKPLELKIKKLKRGGECVVRGGGGQRLLTRGGDKKFPLLVSPPKPAHTPTKSGNFLAPLGGKF